MLLKPIFLLDEPNIVPATSTPVVFPTFIAMTCGQNITVDTIVGASITIQCMQFNGTNNMIEVYKDTELISNSFPHVIAPASDDDFGTYAFSLSNECGRDTVVSRILRQGQFLRFTFSTKYMIP